MITHTSAIILRSVDYQESSKIITVLSKVHGKIALIAQGVKKPKSKLSGVIEIGHTLDVVYYYKTNRAVQNLTEASIKFSSIIFRQDIERASILFATLELIDQLVHEHEENEPVFKFLLTFIEWLSTYKSINPSIFCYVQLRCAELIGFNLAIEIDDPVDGAYLDIKQGIITKNIQSELSHKLTALQTEFLCQVLKSKNSRVFNLEMSVLEIKRLIHLMDVYFKYHIEGYRDRKSDSIFDQMLKDYK